MSFDALNAEQKEAVTTCYSNVLVLAGAGSGKTRTLIERVAWLIEQGASGHEIVCATFTRAAAGEMRGQGLKPVSVKGKPARSRFPRCTGWACACFPATGIALACAGGSSRFLARLKQTSCFNTRAKSSASIPRASGGTGKKRLMRCSRKLRPGQRLIQIPLTCHS